MAAAAAMAASAAFKIWHFQQQEIANNFQTIHPAAKWLEVG